MPLGQPPEYLANPAFVAHEENTEGRDFVVGDIHGKHDLLQKALKGVSFDRQRDRLFSVGDLIDRGAQSYDCLWLAFEPFFHGVLGNHELMAFDALATNGNQNDWNLWQMNGGAWIHGEDAREVAIIAREAAQYLPLAREVTVAGQRVGICHAEPPPDWEDIRNAPQKLVEPTVWSRTRIKKADTTRVKGIDAVVVGHKVLPRPTWLGNVLYVDTGAFTKGGALTLLDLREVVEECRHENESYMN